MFENYKATDKKVTFSNGKTFKVYEKETKKGVRYFYFSRFGGRFFPVSKKEIY
jgi:hypothetical protein